MKKQSWRDWLAAQRERSQMLVQPIPLAGVRGWGMQDEGARFGRSDGSFFSLTGVRVSQAGREVGSWDQPLLEERVGPGMVVLVRVDDRYLISAKAEPGNMAHGRALLSATIQASRSNLDARHGGNRPSRAELLDGREVKFCRFSQDGGRFKEKTNLYAVLDCTLAEVGELFSHERFFTRKELREAVLAGEANQHLLEVLALAFV